MVVRSVFAEHDRIRRLRTHARSVDIEDKMEQELIDSNQGSRAGPSDFLPVMRFLQCHQRRQLADSDIHGGANIPRRFGT